MEKSCGKGWWWKGERQLLSLQMVQLSEVCGRTKTKTHCFETATSILERGPLYNSVLHVKSQHKQIVQDR
jgi:hypothetical protein